MAGIRLLLSFCLLCCCAFHLVINQVDAAREVTTLNYPVKDQRIRIRREPKNYVRRDDCERNKLVDTVHGFLQLPDEDYNVQFIKDSGKYWVEVSWEAPLGVNNSPVGYWFSWLVVRETSATQGYSFVCRFLTAENLLNLLWKVYQMMYLKNTSFVVHESYHWRKDEPIYFKINPLPKKSNSSEDDFFFKGPHNPRFIDLDSYSTPRVSTRAREISTSTSTTKSTNSYKTSQRTTKANILAASAEKKKNKEKEISFYLDSYSTPRVSTRAREISTSTSTTKSTNSYKTSQRTTKANILAASAEKKKNKEKEIFTFITVAIACAAILILGFILVLRKRKRERRGQQVDLQDPGYIYVSYISESKGHTEKVVDFSNWFRKHGYDVQMDIMSTPSNQEDLKELGRRRWGEKQLLRAKNVFIILSPPYLNLCRLDEGKTDASSLTQEEKIIYSEITQIRNELSSTAYISSRFIPVLFGVKETELPFWIKQLVVYSWPDDKMNNKLLYRINEEISYDNAAITGSRA